MMCSMGRIASYLALALAVHARRVKYQKSNPTMSSFAEDQDATSTVDNATQAGLAARISDGGNTVERKYRNYSVIECKIKTVEQAEAVEKLIEERPWVDGWTEEIGVGSETEIMVPPDERDTVIKVLKDYGLEPTIVIRDVGKQLKKEHMDNIRAYKHLPRGSIVGVYPTLEEIDAWMNSLKHPNVTVESLGRSVEGRDIKMVRVASRPGLPIIYLEGGTHAREWIATASMIWQINELLTSVDAATAQLRTAFEWQLVPTANPDGYKYSHTHERLWRKNRRMQSGSCTGVDLNRNWGTNWGTEGVSWNTCSDIYPGSRAFSEPETQALAAHFSQYKSNSGKYDSRMKVYISFHAFMQLWLGPPGAGSRPSDYTRLLNVGKQAAKEATKTHGQPFIAGAPVDILYAASGGSFDWLHQEIGVRYTYSPELRPANNRMNIGFSLPTNEIIPASEEAWAGVLRVVKIVAEEEGISGFR